MKSTAKTDWYSPTSIYLLLWISLSVMFTSCDNGKLSKDEAKKQIDIQLKPKRYGQYEIATHGEYIKGEKFAEGELPHLDALQKNGFITYSITPQPNGYMGYDLKLLDKAKPFIEEEEGRNIPGFGHWNRYIISAGDAEAEILYINEPAPSSDGNIVCNVTYNRKIKLNEFGKAVDFKEERYHTGLHNIGQIVTFVKTQDGWELQLFDNHPIITEKPVIENPSIPK